MHDSNATGSGTLRSVTVRALIEASIEVLGQGRDLLSLVDDRQYVLTDPPYFRQGIGAHLRHCLDAYGCFLRGLATGSIDYDRRERDDRIAQDRAAARDRILHTTRHLSDLMDAAMPDELQVWQDSPHPAASSPARELQFLLSHTIHHYAIIALMLRMQQTEPPADFGVAPSTLAYWHGNAACAR